MASLARLGKRVGSQYLLSFQHPGYAKMWLASLSSSSAAWALIVARAAFILDLTGSAAWTGYVTFAAMIPGVIVSPIAGYLADRFDRRTTIVGLQAIQVGMALIMGLLLLFDALNLWHIFRLSSSPNKGRAVHGKFFISHKASFLMYKKVSP